MKLSEMIEMRDNRQNLQAFLHCSEQIELQNLLNVEHINKLSFIDCCNIVLSMYKARVISNKTASKCFDILTKTNTSFKTERYRYDSVTKSLYKALSTSSGYAYVLVCKPCSKKEYNTRVKRDGKYID